MENSERILVLAPTENDSLVAAKVLEGEGLKPFVCADLALLCKLIRSGCGVIVIAEEAIHKDGIEILQTVLQNQESWSDLPVILITGRGPAKSWEAFSASGNIAILERPFSRLTLVRSVQVGLRARRKQYQTRLLLEQQKEAAQKRDDFFATLSHELRTPLNVILGWVEILKGGNLSAEEREDALTVLERNARLQNALIEDLLDISRIITGKLHFEFKTVSLTKLLTETVKSLEPRAEAKNIELKFELPHEKCAVFADDQRLSQVVSNLLTNAIKFTSKGGEIKIALSRKDDCYVICVKDNGQGIEPSFLPYVFDRLKQEDMSTTRSHGGLGLGLAITSHIVEQHKGHIEAKSEGRGKGSEFIFKIPVASEIIKENMKRPTNPTESLEGVKILVVDDSADILQLIHLWLKRAKAEVRLVSSGAAALKELNEYRPDVLLSDIGMPEMDGYQLISKVRAHSDFAVSHLPAVALTAYAKDEEKTRAIAAGFQLHISKPIASEQLVSAVSSLVHR